MTDAQIKDIVVAAVAQASDRTVEEVEASADAAFFADLGMTSIQVFPLISELEDQLDVEIDFADFLTQAKTVNQTVTFVAGLQ